MLCEDLQLALASQRCDHTRIICASATMLAETILQVPGVGGRGSGGLMTVSFLCFDLICRRLQ